MLILVVVISELFVLVSLVFEVFLGINCGGVPVRTFVQIKSLVLTLRREARSPAFGFCSFWGLGIGFFLCRRVLLWIYGFPVSLGCLTEFGRFHLWRWRISLIFCPKWGGSARWPRFWSLGVCRIVFGCIVWKNLFPLDCKVGLIIFLCFLEFFSFFIGRLILSALEIRKD